MKSEKPKATGESGPKDGKAMATVPGSFPPIRLSERSRQALFALLAIFAIGLVSYVILFAEPKDTPADIDTFVGTVLGSPSVSLFFDMRDTAQDDTSRIYLR